MSVDAPGAGHAEHAVGGVRKLRGITPGVSVLERCRFTGYRTTAVEWSLDDEHAPP